MLDQTFRTDIDHMIPCCLTELSVPAKLTDRFSSVQVFNCFINRCRTFLCSQGRLAWLAQRVAFEATQHLLQVWDEASRISSQPVGKLEDLAIELLHV